MLILLIIILYLIVKHLIVYCKKSTTDESFLLPKKKKLFNRIGIKCLELKKEIRDHNKFEILSEELGNEELSEESIVEKFISTTNSITKDLSITSSTKIRKAVFRDVPQNFIVFKR